MKNLLLLTIIIFSIKTAYTQQSKFDNSSVECYKAQKLFNNFKYAEALRLFKICNTKNKGKAGFLQKIAFCNYKLGKMREAKSNYNALLILDSLNIQSLNQLALINMEESNTRKSIIYYQKLIDIDSTNSFYYSQLGNLYRKIDDLTLSIEYFNKALKLNPKNTIVLGELANIYKKLTFLNKADSLINLGIEIDSANIRLLNIKARILYRRQKYDDAIKVIDKVLALNADSSSSMLQIMATSYFHLKDFKKSIELFEKIIGRGADSEIIYYFLGKSYMEIGDNVKSLKYFKKALEKGLSANLPFYNYNIAFILENEGKYLESIKYYKEQYHYSKDKSIMYKIAKNYDTAFADKRPALRYYKKYIKLNDKENKAFIKYSKARILAIKEYLHQNVNASTKRVE